MIFAPQDAPAIVADCLADISDNFSMGKTVSQVLELVSHRLGTIDKDGDREMLDSSDFDQEGYDVSDEEDVDEDYFPDDEMGDRHHILHETGTSLSATAHMGSTSALKKKIQHDLRVAKDMGFRIGAVGNPLQGTNCYVSLSCRISKLGISREAMKAWDLEPSDYVIVILHYPHGYKSMESVLAMRDTNTFRQNFGVKIGVSKFYRPTAEEAIGAFTTVSKGKEKNRDPPSESVSSSGKETGFRNCFISRPLNDGLFPDQFYSILKIRNEHTELRWDGAEAYHNDSRGTLAADVQSVQKHLYQAMNSSNAEYPSIVTSDHLRYTEPADQSLPLVAMQFALRHFVRCTEFCLICFSKLPNDIQALKPYVCDNPLCLYQYMRLGFGPSIEHEILSQPKVVDLLISFCYRSARDFKLKDFPSGMGLMVPPLEALDPAPASSDAPRPFVSPWVTPAIGPAQAPPVAANPVPVVSPIYTSLNEHMREMIFPDKSQPCPVRTGQWIALKETKNRGPTGGPIGFKTRHCRVEDTTFWPTVKLSPFGKCLPILRRQDCHSTALVTGCAIRWNIRCNGFAVFAVLQSRTYYSTNVCFAYDYLRSYSLFARCCNLSRGLRWLKHPVSVLFAHRTFCHQRWHLDASIDPSVVPT